MPPPRGTDIFAGEPPPQPVALALAQVVADQEGGLTRRWFDRVLDARMADLERTQPETIEEMETYVKLDSADMSRGFRKGQILNPVSLKLLPKSKAIRGAWNSNKLLVANVRLSG